MRVEASSHVSLSCLPLQCGIRWDAHDRRADLEVLSIRAAQQTDLLVDVTLRHDSIGSGRNGWINHGKLRNPDHPDQILEGAAAVNIRNFRNPIRRNRQVAFLPACMSTSGLINGDSCACVIC